MSTPTQILTNITPPRVPLTNEKTGLISREWYRFFLNIFTLTGSGQNYVSLVDLQVGPPPLQIDQILSYLPPDFNVSPSQDGILAQILELAKQVNDLASAPPPTQGTITAVTATTPVLSSGGIAPDISIPAATTSVSGYLTSTDWNVFNNKAPATSGTSILYGNGTGGFSNVTIGSGVSFASGTLSATGTGGTVTSVTGTSPVVSSGGTTPDISLAASYGDTQNPYAAKTANYFLAAPNGSAGAPTFRAIAVADVPTLNQNTSGSAASLSATLVATSGGTGQSSYAVGDLLYASSTTALSKLADVATGNAVISGGVGVAPSWGKIGLTTHVSGTLPTANGGTNLTSFTANGVVYASSSSALANGSSLTFDGTNFATTGTSSATTFTATGGRSIFNASNEPFAVAARYVSTGGAVYFGATDGTGTPGLQLSLATGASGLSIDSSRIVTMPVYGVGTATFSAAGVISSVSDETWKIKDGVPADPDAMLKKLEPGYWYYNNEKKETFGVERQLGFYAQNVNAAIGPEAAPEPSSHTNTNLDGSETTTTRPWGYYDRSVLAVTVMSLQKALATIESLTVRIEKLESAFGKDI